MCPRYQRTQTLTLVWTYSQKSRGTTCKNAVAFKLSNCSRVNNVEGRTCQFSIKSGLQWVGRDWTAHTHTHKKVPRHNSFTAALRMFVLQRYYVFEFIIYSMQFICHENLPKNFIRVSVAIAK